MLAYLPNESNSLLFSMALSYLGDCQRIFPSDSRPLEQALWKIVTTNPVSQHRLQAFRLYRSIADSEEAVQRLYTLWQERKAPKDCALSESDYIGLSYMLAMHLPEKRIRLSLRNYPAYRIRTGRRSINLSPHLYRPARRNVTVSSLPC